MATYAIGDIQGCYDEFQRLLERIAFDPAKDLLWLTGDLVNRGRASLKTLRFVKSLGDRCITVLGNHDLAMLTIARGAEPYDPLDHTFLEVLEAEDREEILEWLEQRPLIYYDETLKTVLVHAGIYPAWDLETALSLSREVEAILGSPQKYEFYPHHFGNSPTHWDPTLEGFLRTRFIVNCLTRMRFVSLTGELDFHSKESSQKNPPGFYPWFEMLNQNLQKYRIIFGHWSALQGECNTPNVFALDTGCVWGGSLTALRLEDNQRISVACKL